MTRSARALARLALWTALLAPGTALSQPTVAVVDSARAMTQCEAGLRAQATLKKLFDARQLELEAKQQQLAKDRAALDREVQSGKLSRDAAQKKTEAWQARATELQGYFVDYQKEFTRKQADLTAPIDRDLNTAVARLAKAAGIALVVDRSAARYLEPALDLTDQVIAALNAGATK